MKFVAYAEAKHTTRAQNLEGGKLKCVVFTLYMWRQLNPPIKKQKLSKWIEKQTQSSPVYCHRKRS